VCPRCTGHAVVLLTSHPEVVPELAGGAPSGRALDVRPYRTFDDLRQGMEELVRRGRLDAVIHCAAVSDYQSGGIFAPGDGTRFDPDSGRWRAMGRRRPLPTARPTRSRATSRSCAAPGPAPKLVDWDPARGLLRRAGQVQAGVGVNEEELLQVAEKSRLHSSAD